MALTKVKAGVMATASVATASIVNDAVNADKLASNSVVTDSIVNNAVTTDKIADDAITAAKIADAVQLGAYTSWAIKTGTYTAVHKDQLIANSGSAFTITLPAGTAGNTVIIANAGAGTVTVGRNGSQKINSVAEDGTLAQGNSVQLVYVDDTIGWFEI